MTETKTDPIWITVSVTQALESYGGCQAGWWTSQDGTGQLDMAGATVAQAIAEMRERACSDEADRRDIMAGTIDVGVTPAHPEHAALVRLLDAYGGEA